MTTEQLLREFKKIYKETKDLVNEFPQEKREEILFDKWSLKDVLAHFSNWVEHDLSCFRALEEGKEPFWVPNIDEYNKQGVLDRENKKWEDIYAEFSMLFNQLIIKYETLPENLWGEKFWGSREFTPRKFLEGDIKHLGKDHLPQLKKVKTMVKR